MVEITKTQQAKRLFKALRDDGTIPNASFTGLIDRSFYPMSMKSIWVSSHNKAYYLDEMGSGHLSNIISLYQRNGEMLPDVISTAYGERLGLEAFWLAQRKAREEFKTRMSVIILRHVAKTLDMTFEDYCSVYDSTAHEKMLNEIMVEVVNLNG